jgi:hypothetical protein
MALPAPLANSTAAAASLVAAGQPFAGTVSPLTVTLTRGVLRDMLLARLKWSLVVLVGIVVVGVGTTLLMRPTASMTVAAAADPKPEAVRPPGIAWGEPLDGLRLGLAPDPASLFRDERDLKVTIWYENVSKETKQVPVQRDLNVLRLMFAGEKDGQPFFADYRMARLAITPARFEPLEPGKRLHEEFVLRLGEEWNGLRGLPALEPSKSLTLRAGLCARGDTEGEKSWKAEDTLRSGPITVRRLEKDAPIAWGEPHHGLRIGLAPTALELAHNEKEIRLTIWVENTGKEARKLPLQAGSTDLFGLMVAGEKIDKQFRPTFVAAPRYLHDVADTKSQTLGPGQRFKQELSLAPGEGWHGWGAFPGFEPGESLVLRIGLYSVLPAEGERHKDQRGSRLSAAWKADDTLRSEAIKITRSAKDR